MTLSTPLWILIGIVIALTVLNTLSVIRSLKLHMSKKNFGRVSEGVNDNPIQLTVPQIEKVAMSDEDSLFYIIKYGHEPVYRIEKVPMDDGPNEISDNQCYIKFVLTNIPKEEE